MSRREHWVLRLVAIAIIAAAWWLPHSTSTPAGSSTNGSVEPHAIHASVAAR